MHVSPTATGAIIPAAATTEFPRPPRRTSSTFLPVEQSSLCQPTHPHLQATAGRFICLPGTGL